MCKVLLTALLYASFNLYHSIKVTTELNIREIRHATRLLFVNCTGHGLTVVLILIIPFGRCWKLSQCSHKVPVD